MVTPPTSLTEEPATLSLHHWWLSLYPRLSAKSKRGLVAVSLGAAMLIQAIGMKDSPAHSQSPYNNPAVQNALHQLGLSEYDPISGQFQVNSYTTSRQRASVVAIDSDGDFVIVWNSLGSSGSDTDDYSVQAQRYNAAGVSQGAQFQVNSYTTGRQIFSDVAMDSDGNFVIVWSSDGSNGSDTDDYSIQAQRYDAAGVPQNSQFQVNSYTTNRQRNPVVALDSDGDFVVIWMSYGSSATDTDVWSIQGQRYNATGTAQGSQFQVNNYITDTQAFPAVAMDSDGDFVVTWESNGSFWGDSSDLSIQRRRYNSSGTAQGSEFQVNSYTTGKQSIPSISLDDDGDFVIVWMSSGSSGSDTDYESIQGQRYNNAGIPQGIQFQINTYTTGEQLAPKVAMEDGGDFVVVWHSWGSSDNDIYGTAILGQQYHATATPYGSEFQVNSYTTNSQAAPAVALDSDGDFVVTWQSDGSNYGDTDQTSIQGHRFAPSEPQFQVNTYTTNTQEYTNVAMDSDGDFVIVWHSYGSDDNDTSYYSVQGQRYNSSGIPEGDQFQVNNYTTNNQSRPAVAMDSDGDFVVIWESFGATTGDTSFSSIQGQRYNSAGAPQGDQFQINSFTSDHQRYPAVAMDSDGDFVTVWESSGSYGSDNSGSIQGQRFDATGIPQGSQFQVNTYTTDSQQHPAVAVDSAGDFVIVWESLGSDSDTSLRSIQGQRYDAAGTPLGSQFQANTYTIGSQVKPAVTMDSNGNFVVVWHSFGSDGDDDTYSIQGQLYSAAGTVQGNQFQVNSYTTSFQSNPAVASDAEGGFIVVWNSNGSDDGDMALTSIQGQHYNSAGTAQASQFQINSYTTGHQMVPVVAMESEGLFVVAWQSYGSNGGDTSQYSIQAKYFYASSPTLTPTPSLTPTDTPMPTNTPTPSPTTTNTPNPSPTPTTTANPTSTPTPTPEPTNTPTPTATTSPIGHSLYLPAVISDSSP